MIELRPGVALVDVVRSGVVESVHTGHLVLVDVSGEITVALGVPDQPVFPRSSNKPLQAVGMVEAGLNGSSDQLALAAASHSGEPRHLDVVAAMLAAGGFTANDLRCPPSWPLGDAAREQWIAAGRPQQRIAMNCSGKHAAMLLTCRARGWDPGSYLDPSHPVQRRLAATTEDLTGEPVAAIGVDGCGAPVLAFGLVGLARAFLRLAAATDGSLRAVADAMRAHPGLLGGTGRLVTTLMASVPGLVAKDGAEGVFAAALPGAGAVAVKIDDGGQRAAERAVVAGLRRLGAALPPDDARVLGGGTPVGQISFRSGLL